MKTRPNLIGIAALIFVSLQGCFPDLSNKKFDSFLLYLYNNSSKKDCNPDSINVTFAIKNISKVSSKEVIIDVLASDVKYATIEGTRDEQIKVKVLNSADSTLILEQVIKIGKSVYVGGDLATRQVAYCSNTALGLTNFEK